MAALREVALFVQQLSLPPQCSVSIKVMFMALSMSISGMSNKACPFTGTTKNLHISCLLLCSIFMLHVPNSVIVLLYVLIVYYHFLLLPNAH